MIFMGHVHVISMAIDRSLEYAAVWLECVF